VGSCHSYCRWDVDQPEFNYQHDYEQKALYRLVGEIQYGTVLYPPYHPTADSECLAVFAYRF
jgi:hypothetical protein